jgi:hypothetical protein
MAEDVVSLSSRLARLPTVDRERALAEIADEALRVCLGEMLAVDEDDRRLDPMSGVGMAPVLVRQCAEALLQVPDRLGGFQVLRSLLRGGVSGDGGGRPPRGTPGCRASSRGSGCGTVNTHCRKRCAGNTSSTRCAAVLAMRRPPQRGQITQDLQEKATMQSWAHGSQRSHMKP